VTVTLTAATVANDEHFRGPFADGPPPEALRIDAPSIRQFHPRELVRLVVVVSVLGSSVLAALARRVLRRQFRSVADAACNGLIDGCIRLGPTTVKAGQILASSGAMFPPVLAEAARRCLDAVPPFPVEHVRRTIAEDLGRPVEEIFASFDDAPLSAASIGQVHACTLADGRDAVVKVQRPGIYEQMATDLRIGFRLAWLVEKSPWGRQTNARDIIRDLHGVTFQELNPAHEAWQQHRFREKIWAFGDNEEVTAPEVYWDHCGPRVICMERVYGIPMDHFDEMAARGIDGQVMLRFGAKVWAESVMVHGPFHGDMHAGNVWVLDDGRGCYLDFGIMGELPDEWKQLLKDLFYTCTFDLDFVRVARAYRRVGAIPEGMGTDEELGAFLRDMLGPILTNGFGGLDIAQLVAQSLEMLKAYSAVAPQELVLVAKQLLYVDKYTKYLAPDYSITADPFIVKNIFPAEAAAKAAELGISLDRAGDPLAGQHQPMPSNHQPEIAPAAEHPGDAVRHPFLSPEWIDAVRAIRNEYLDQVPAIDVPAVRANLTVTGAPFGSGSVEAHTCTVDGTLDVELGHLPDADLSVTVDHETAKSLIVDQQPQLAMQAFFTGKISIDGDLSKVLGGGDPMAMFKALNLSGMTGLGDIDPVAAEIGERIKAVTA
jgi:predicted unusual protein kinase regulating ubiquinone biosynthesis (AarF/ABC1/UbiB family)